MTLDRWLALAGLVLALPGFLLIFLSTAWVIGLLCLLLAAVGIVAATVVRHLSSLPPFTLSSAKVVLELMDRQGKAARLTKEYRIRPNYGHLRMMTHKNIAADGAVRDIRWNDVLVPANFVTAVLGEYVVDIHFPNPLPRWREFPGKLSYDALDSFGGNPESLYYNVDFPTKIVTLTVQFPADRPCLHASAVEIEGAGERPISEPTVSADRQRLELTLRNPRMGSEFCIRWDW